MRKASPISAGLPNELGTCAADERLPLAASPITTITSTSSAAAAATAARDCTLGPLAHGASALPPR